MLSINTIGELNVSVSGKNVPLPPSKKTRALLVYLALTSRPHRRDRLCEMLWDIPDDPRGALRWSLSKLRKIVNDDEDLRLHADRERVEFVAENTVIDIRQIEKTLEQSSLSVKALTNIFTHTNQSLLEGIDLPNHPNFQNWLTAERASVARLALEAAFRIAEHSDTQANDKIKWLRATIDIDPFHQDATRQLVLTFEQIGNVKEAKRLANDFAKRFKGAGIQWSTKTSPRQQALGPDTSLSYLKKQKIKFCEASDKARIAYATVGEGPPLVKAANWLSHLELDWDAPIWSPLFRQLAQDRTFIRYDERGNGLSDWDVKDISFDMFVEDLEILVDSLGLKSFPLLGISQGAAVSIEYAVRHPQRVSHLILFGAYAAGWRIDATPELIREREAIMTLTETGWGQDNPAYRQIFSSSFMPSASSDDLHWFNDFQKQTTSPSNAAKFQSAFGDIDVRDKLSKVQAPTLVLHSAGDQRIPISSSREIAASIPNAEFVSLKSDNHLLIGNEPASSEFVDAVREFLRDKRLDNLNPI